MPSQGRLSLIEKQQRLDAIEQLMTRRLTVSAVTAWAKKEWSIGERQVRDYIKGVRDRWAREALSDDRREERSHMRASLNDIFARAMSRSEVVKDSAGNPIIDPKTSKPITREVPDLRTAVRAAESICRLDGLYQDRLQIGGGRAGALPAGNGNTINIFVGRSDEELRHYARRGVFPEDTGGVPKAAIPATVVG